MRVLVLLLMGLILGCAPKGVPIPEEIIGECDRLVRMTERVYFDKNPEEVLAAATQLFHLTGGGYAVTRSADGLNAHRTRTPIAVGGGGSFDGSDTWQLVVQDVTVCQGGSGGIVVAVESDPTKEVRGMMDHCRVVVPGVKLSVYHIPELYSQSLIPTECFASPVFKPAVSRFTTTPAVYDLFFLRMDRLLGKSAQWPSCESYSEYVRNNIYYRDQFSVLNFQGHLDGLCTQVKDSVP